MVSMYRCVSYRITEYRSVSNLTDRVLITPFTEAFFENVQAYTVIIENPNKVFIDQLAFILALKISVSTSTSLPLML